MLCESCGTELEPVMVICSACGARVRHGREEVDWRQHVHETVERHKEKRRREQSRHDAEARQLSIFPDVSEEDEESRVVRERRAEIRARVEARLRKAPRHAPIARRRDVGEVSLARRAAAATMPDLSREPDPGMPAIPAMEKVPTTSTMPEMPAMDPSAAPLDSLSEKSVDLAPDRDVPRFESPERAASSEPFMAFGLASPGERVLSGLIDLAFVSLIQFTLFYLTTHLVAQRLVALPTSAVISMSLVGLVLAASYFLFFWSLSGQTLGKLLTGGRVVTTVDGPLGFRRAATRLAGTVVSVLPLGAGFFGMWTDSERRGWHDRIAGTKVVRG